MTLEEEAWEHFWTSRLNETLNDELRSSPHPPPSAQNGVIKHGLLAFSHSSTVFCDGRFAAILDWGNFATPLSLRLLGFQISSSWLVPPCVVSSTLASRPAAPWISATKVLGD